MTDRFDLPCRKSLIFYLLCVLYLVVVVVVVVFERCFEMNEKRNFLAGGAGCGGSCVLGSSYLFRGLLFAGAGVFRV